MAVDNSTQQSLNKLVLDVELLKKDIQQMGAIYSKLDSATEKLRELTAAMTNMLSTHDMKFSNMEKTNSVIQEEMEYTREHNAEEIKKIEAQIKSLKEEMLIPIHNIDRRICEKIEKLDEKVEIVSKWKEKAIGIASVIVLALSFLIPKLLSYIN